MWVIKVFSFVLLYLMFLKTLGVLVLQYYSNQRLIKNYYQIYKSGKFIFLVILNIIFLILYLSMKSQYLFFGILSLNFSYILIFKTNRLVFTRRSVFLSIYGFIILLCILAFPISVIFYILCSSSILIVLYVGFINKIEYPLETLIRMYYLKKARKKLKNNHKVKIIAVTGSFGKTSLKTYLKQVLEYKYRVLCSPGSINTLMGLTKFINENFDNYVEILILEVGVDEVGGMDKILKLFKPHIGVLTAIGKMHMATFKTINNIFLEKIKLLSLSDIGYYNFDNEYLSTKENMLKKYHKYSKNEFFSNYQRTEYGIKTKVFAKHQIIIPIYGLFNLSALSMVIKIAFSFGFLESEIIHILISLKGEKHRLEKRIDDKLIILDDCYNGNYTGILEGIETLLTFKGVKAIITPGVVELGKEYYNTNYKLGQKMCKIDYIFIVGEEHHPIIKGYKSMSKKQNIFWVKSFKEGYQQIRNMKIDVLLIANDTHQTFIK